MTGVDSSPAMLAGAAAARRGPGCASTDGDIARWTSAGDLDLVFSNAALQWVPDHQGVVARWWAALRRVASSPCRSRPTPATRRTASPPRSRRPSRSCAAMGGAPPPDPVAANVLDPVQYAILLDHLGAARQHVRLQVYGHTLARSADVVEWVRGTSLTRFERVLAPDAVRAVRRRVPPPAARAPSATPRRTSTRSAASCSGDASPAERDRRSVAVRSPPDRTRNLPSWHGSDAWSRRWSRRSPTTARSTSTAPPPWPAGSRSRATRGSSSPARPARRRPSPTPRS